ncbi:MAG: ATP-dependent DNA helicase RecG [Rikenellaceae bacterium]|jgi:ATP-dependent DNA helicase RecG|nr:ATP-dependent DNA helicase RecG [Rikenellaceae bacterium]
MTTFLDNDIKYLAGVGDARAALLGKELGIRTLGDLLYYFPFRYIDRTKIYRIADVTEENDEAFIQIRARVQSKNLIGEARKQRLSVVVADGSGVTELVWFRGVKWIEKRLEVGREYIIFGRPNFFKGLFSMVHPEVEALDAARNRPNGSMQGVYHSTERLGNLGLGSKGIYNLVCNLWAVAGEKITETLPPEVIEQQGLISLKDALLNIHFPQTPALLKAAEYRLKFEELFGIQLNILSKRSVRLVRGSGMMFSRVGELFGRFYNELLPFPLTEAQKRVIKEIRGDTVSGFQMNRLLQGDVGSGKTLVALVSMLIAADNGYQSCLMAPTEILARQHFASIGKMVEGLPIKIAILTGASKAAERRQSLEGIADGSVDILIGTHALIEDRVQFSNLGLVIIDEQHRFGVEQRARLWTKNKQPPHILVMTATPIPRTLAMTLYGDLDVSVIDQLPPGRRPIKTLHRTDAERLALWGFMKREIAKGRQVYVVYPLIKESEKMDYKDLYDGFESISRDFPRPRYQVVAVHGKMKPEDKQSAMNEFKRGVYQIMVATSVIEVGVDVPNATVMVIESAERFGLSQLHQLRGRVGRGGEQSYCVLMSGEKLSKEARQRLDAMVRTNDGFELAELDMKLRGSGDISGTQQSGMAFDLKIANLGRDQQIIELTRRVAEGILAHDPLLQRPENALLQELKERYSTAGNTDFSMIS